MDALTAGRLNARLATIGQERLGSPDRLKAMQRERTVLREKEDKLKQEIRSLKSRESSLQVENDQLRTQVQEIPALRKHFDLLVKEHGESKEKRKQIAADLKSEVVKGKTSIAERSQALADVGRELETAHKRLEVEGERVKEAELQLRVRKNEADHLLASVTAAAASSLASRADVSPRTYRKAQDALHASRLRAHRLQRQVADRDAQTAALVELVQHLEIERDHWRDSVDELDDDLATLTKSAAKDRSLAAKNRREAGERIAELARRLHEAEQEVCDLRARLKVDKRTAKVLNEATHERDAALRNELKATRFALADVDKEAAALRKRLPALEEDVKDARAKLSATKDELETEKQAKLEALKAKAKTETALSEATEAKNRLTGLLTQSRAAEAALQDELTSAEAALGEMSDLQEQHTRLRQTLETFIARSDLAERDAAALSQINSELGGHASTQQKIHHLAKVRGELAEMRRKHAAATAELAAARREADSLREEVTSYKAVGTAPLGKLSRVLRPVLGSIGNQR